MNSISGGQPNKSGFTIVELLIVVVVIAILAAITIVSYVGIQNRAHDTAVQTDLRQMGAKIQEYYTTHSDTFPFPSASGIGSLSVTTSKNSYGAPYVVNGNEYNYLYCYSQTSNAYALFAGSKSGNVYMYKNGALSSRGPMVASATLCNDAGMDVSDRVSGWFYGQSGSNAWQSWIK